LNSQLPRDGDGDGGGEDQFELECIRAVRV
jgi:hypothetical protein